MTTCSRRTIGVAFMGEKLQIAVADSNGRVGQVQVGDIVPNYWSTNTWDDIIPIIQHGDCVATTMPPSEYGGALARLYHQVVEQQAQLVWAPIKLLKGGRTVFLAERVVEQAYSQPQLFFPVSLADVQQWNLCHLQAIWGSLTDYPLPVAVERVEMHLRKTVGQLVSQSAVYQQFFQGCDLDKPFLAATILARVQDIRRFWVVVEPGKRPTPHSKGADKFKAYCGVHILEGGHYPRSKTAGVDMPWDGQLRGTFHELARTCFWDRPDSVWGKVMAEYMVRLRRNHPAIVDSPDGKGKLYNDKHIKEMALVRTITRLVERLYDTWSTIALAQLG